MRLFPSLFFSPSFRSYLSEIIDGTRSTFSFEMGGKSVERRKEGRMLERIRLGEIRYRGDAKSATTYTYTYSCHWTTSLTIYAKVGHKKVRKRGGEGRSGSRGLRSVRSAEGLPRWSSSSLSSILGRSATKFEGGALRPRANGDFVRLDLRQGRSRGSSTAARGRGEEDRRRRRGRARERARGKKEASVVAALLRRPASNLRRTRNLLRRKQYRLRGAPLSSTRADIEGWRTRERTFSLSPPRELLRNSSQDRNISHPRPVLVPISLRPNGSNGDRRNDIEVSRACNLAASARLASSIAERSGNAREQGLPFRRLNERCSFEA